MTLVTFVKGIVPKAIEAYRTEYPNESLPPLYISLQRDLVAFENGIKKSRC